MSTTRAVEQLSEQNRLKSVVFNMHGISSNNLGYVSYQLRRERLRERLRERQFAELIGLVVT